MRGGSLSCCTLYHQKRHCISPKKTLLVIYLRHPDTGLQILITSGYRSGHTLTVYHRLCRIVINFFGYGFNRSICHVSCVDVRLHWKRSCKREAPSAQNSISIGTIRKPPQCGGRSGESPCSVLAVANCCIRACRDANVCDCCEAQAPNRLCRSRD